jgi:hypothetical protein
MISVTPVFNVEKEDLSGINPTAYIVRVTYLGPV